MGNLDGILRFRITAIVQVKRRLLVGGVEGLCLMEGRDSPRRASAVFHCELV